MRGGREDVAARAAVPRPGDVHHKGGSAREDIMDKESCCIGIIVFSEVFKEVGIELIGSRHDKLSEGRKKVSAVKLVSQCDMCSTYGIT